MLGYFHGLGNETRPQLSSAQSDDFKSNKSRGLPKFTIRRVNKTSEDLGQYAIKRGFIPHPIYLMNEYSWDNDLGYNTCKFSTTVEKDRRETYWNETYRDQSYLLDDLKELYADEFKLNTSFVGNLSFIN